MRDSGKLPGLLSAASGVLLVLIFPLPSFYPLAWAALAPLVIASVRAGWPRRAFALGYLAGAVWGAGSLFWTYVYHPAAALIIIGVFSLYPGLFSLAVHIVTRRLGCLSLPLSVPVCWTFFEYLRTLGFLGFPWNCLGYSQGPNLPLIQIAEYTGVFGVTFVLCLANAGIAAAWLNRRLPRLACYVLAVSLITPLLATAWGRHRFEQTRKTWDDHDTITIAGIQPSIHPGMSWSRYAPEILLAIEELSAEAAAEDPLIIVFPETVISEDLKIALSENPWIFRVLNSISESTGSYLLIGAHYSARDGLHNSAYLKSPECRITGRYDKIKLVPGGEHLPYLRDRRPVQKILGGAAGYTPGTEKTVFEAGGHEFSVLICFEGAFGNLSRQFVKKGAGFLVNITNDAWSLSRTSHYQHASKSVFRSVENRVYLVRTGNTGITKTINPAGQTEAQLEYWKRGQMVRRILPGPPEKTFYTLYGDLFSHANIAAFVLLAAAAGAYGRIRIRDPQDP